jgi:transcription elongation factor Elf1
MATTLNRGSTWTNADGLVIGFGPNKPVKEGAVQKNDGNGVKTQAVIFTYDDMSDVNVALPAGSKVVDVYIDVIDAFADGTSLEVGDGSDADGFITATEGAVAELTAGKRVMAQGVYTHDNTADGDVTAYEMKEYASADTIDLTVTGTFTAGKAALVVLYI